MWKFFNCLHCLQFYVAAQKANSIYFSIHVLLFHHSVYFIKHLLSIKDCGSNEDKKKEDIILPYI